jgi:hypothetical protein
MILKEEAQMQANVLIPLVHVNVGKCLYLRCPVQLSSACVSHKITELKEALNKQPLRPEDIPGVYCATGIAASTDIKVEQDCVCGKCVIFPEYRLFNYEPMCHYCISGSAK